MTLILLGAPGSGKGTQGARLVDKYGVPKISTGEIFRDLAAKGTELGLEAKKYWSAGKLVPDEIVVGLLRERISHEDCRYGFILDGFPRTVEQAETLNELIKECEDSLDAVLDFEVSDEELIRRLSGRWTCTHCGATYHVTSLPPRKNGICDHCGNPLIQRTDDTPESIRTRLAEYRAKTEPLLGYYRERELLYPIDANAEPDVVFGRVEAALQRVFHGQDSVTISK